MGILLDELLTKTGQTPTVTPRPVQPIQQPQKQEGLISKVAGTAMAGLGKAGELISIPYQKTEEFLTGGKGYEEKIGEFQKPYIEKLKGTPFGELAEPAAKIGRTAGAFGARMALDPLNLLGVGLVRQAISLPFKAAKPIAAALKLPQLGQKVMQFARKTPQIYKPLEATVAPYFRSPEAGKIIEAAKATTRGRINQLTNLIDKAKKSLTITEQRRIGQLLEGGVVARGKIAEIFGEGVVKTITDPKLVKIAGQFNKIADDIGQEAVELGIFHPEAYKQMKGRYMHHMWESALGKKPSIFYKTPAVPTLGTAFTKARTGMEGYERAFAAPTLRGLGRGTADIEAARMFQQLAGTFGKGAEPLKTPSALTSELMNLLLKTGKKIKLGLGEVKPRFVTGKEAGAELLDVFRKFQPAHKVPGDIGMDILGKAVGIKGGKEIIKKTLSPSDAQLFAKTIWGDPEAQRAYSFVMQQLGFTPTEGDLRVFLQKVGQLPGIKPSKLKLPIAKAIREIPEGFKYAPEELTRAHGGQLLKDVALPEAIIDYIKRVQPSTPSGWKQVYHRLFHAWKAGVTIWNPAYHVRNMPSNVILAELQTGKGFIPTAIENFKNLLGKVNKQYYDEALQGGLIKQRYLGEAIEDFFASAYKKPSLKDKILKAPGSIQRAFEDAAKLTVFEHFRKKDIPIQETVKLAEEAIFSPYRLGVQEKGISNLFPFYSFTRQAAPYLGKKLLTHPERFTKYPKMERAVESLTQPEQEKYLPNWMKGMVRTPLKTKEGQRQYLNLKYFYPWGQFMGEQGASSLFGISPTLGLGLNPALEEAFSLRTGRDPYFGYQYVRPGMTPEEKAKAITEHAVRRFMPAPARSAEKIAKAALGKEDYAGRKRGLGTTLAGELTGLRLYPFDVAKGATRYSEELEQINREATTEINIILKDRSMPIEDKRNKIKAINDFRLKRLKEILSR